MRADEEGGGPDRVRLPGFEQRAARQTRHDWDNQDFGPRGGYAQRKYARESGFRTSRRASNWTAAALIAAVAATTGYLAHSIPASTTASTTSGQGATTPTGKSTAVKAGAPSVSGPVVTSGGSGVAAGSAAGGGGRDN